jgi:putative tributyrin esterase
VTRLMSRVWTAAAVLAVAVAPPVAAEVQSASFWSASLGRDVSVAVQLPPSYAARPDRRYPVVVALHGLFEGPSFLERRGLAPAIEQLWRSGRVPEFILVAPDGGNSFYVNGPGGRYEDLVTQDTPAWIEANYRALPHRAGRGLLGVSMGGYAALRVALAHPEVYAAVATHSAMLLEGIPTREAGAGRWHMEAFHAVFGDPIDPSLWAANDPLALAAKADPKTTPALRFDCGAQDRFGLFRGNADLHERLRARGIPHEFELPPGDHGYEYVLRVLEKSLRFLESALRLPAAPS